MTLRTAIRQWYSPALLALVWAGLLLLPGVLGTISIQATPDDFGLNGVVVLMLWVALLVVWVAGIGAFMLGAVIWRAWLRRQSRRTDGTSPGECGAALNRTPQLMNAALPRARHYLVQGEHKKAADALWLVERDARSNLAESNELVALAGTLRDATSGRLREQADNLLGHGQQHVARLTRELEGTTSTVGGVSASGRHRGFFGSGVRGHLSHSGRRRDRGRLRRQGN